MEILNKEITKSKMKLIDLLREINTLNEFKNNLSKNNKQIAQKYQNITKDYINLKSDISLQEAKKEILREEIKKIKRCKEYSVSNFKRITDSNQFSTSRQFKWIK